MNKHTPGPWHWDSDAVKGDTLMRVRYRVTTIGKTVTQCYYSSADPQSEWDARLIAAAPDLLNALNSLLRHAERVNDVMAEEVGVRFVDTGPLDMARAAIARATGGEQ